MATFVLIHGAGGRGSDWSLVAGELEARGHEVIAPDLPCEDPVGLDAYAGTVIDAIGDRRERLVVVSHSLGGLTAPVVADRIPVAALVFVTAMVALPGERGADWWGNVGQGAAMAAQHLTDDSDETVFFHDVPAHIQEASMLSRGQTGEVMDGPSPLTAWPDVATTFLVCRDDRFFPAAWMADVVRTRFGVEPETVPGGHCPYLSQPIPLADAIERAWTGRAAAPPVTLAASPV